jgi:hypothetical protein
MRVSQAATMGKRPNICPASAAPTTLVRGPNAHSACATNVKFSGEPISVRRSSICKSSKASPISAFAGISAFAYENPHPLPHEILTELSSAAASIVVTGVAVSRWFEQSVSVVYVMVNNAQNDGSAPISNPMEFPLSLADRARIQRKSWALGDKIFPLDTYTTALSTTACSIPPEFSSGVWTGRVRLCARFSGTAN